MGKKYWVTLGLVMMLLTGCGEETDNEAVSQSVEIEVGTTCEEGIPEGAVESVEDEVIPEEEGAESEVTETDVYDFTICFAGDINLDEGWSTTEFMDGQENGIRDCLSPELIAHMQEADIMCLNNEFTYSMRGTPTEGKLYHFRANPGRVEVLQELGVDLVKLANNHIYDYGENALVDTLAVLEQAGIRYMGAGQNLEEAMEPVYVELDDKTIAFVSATRAEKNLKTPQATEESAGVLHCYDTELLKQVIAEADANADFVLAYVHWGAEYSYQLEEEQLTSGKEYLDAGADIIIGAHTHCLQGMEYYDGKPIVYSLGNYWFNNKTMDTILLELHFYGDGEEQHLDVKVIPAVQSGCKTTYADTREEQERIYRFLEKMSINVEITEEGLVREYVSPVG